MERVIAHGMKSVFSSPIRHAENAKKHKYQWQRDREHACMSRDRVGRSCGSFRWCKRELVGTNWSPIRLLIVGKSDSEMKRAWEREEENGRSKWRRSKRNKTLSYVHLVTNYVCFKSISSIVSNRALWTLTSYWKRKWKWKRNAPWREDQQPKTRTNERMDPMEQKKQKQKARFLVVHSAFNS